MRLFYAFVQIGRFSVCWNRRLIVSWGRQVFVYPRRNQQEWPLAGPTQDESGGRLRDPR